MRRNKAQWELQLVTQLSTNNKEQSSNLIKFSSRAKLPLQVGQGGHIFQIYIHSFHGSDAIDAEFLPDLADMHIDRAITNNYVIAPNLAEDFISQKTRPGREASK